MRPNANKPGEVYAERGALGIFKPKYEKEMVTVGIRVPQLIKEDLDRWEKEGKLNRKEKAQVLRDAVLETVSRLREKFDG